MSSEYVIPRKESINKPISEWEEGIDFISIGRTWSFHPQFQIIMEYVKDETPIICIDNGTDITNVKELKEYYLKHNK